MRLIFFAVVAQLVEHVIGKEQVYQGKREYVGDKRHFGKNEQMMTTSVPKWVGGALKPL